MPSRQAISRARRDKRAGRSASTQAGEFVREEIDKIRRGEHGARNTKQAIAIGLSEARRAGVELPPPKRGRTSERTRRSAQYAYDAGHGHPHGTSSPAALSRQAHSAARGRTAADRSAAARKAARTKGPAGRHAPAAKGARTRARHGR